MSLLKTSIEDVAFTLWSGIGHAYDFAGRFLREYPGFEEIWDVGSLAKALADRV